MKILNKNFWKERKNKTLTKFLVFTFLILFGFWLGTKGLVALNSILKSNQYGAKNSVISPKQLKKELENKDFTLINVHTPYEGEIGRTDTFIEYDSMKANEYRLPKDKNAKIILYCKTGRMSEEALTTLKSMGYTNVRHLEGGMDKWVKEGYGLIDLSSLPQQVLPEEGFELPISWGSIAQKLAEIGVVDREKFEKVVVMSEEEKLIFEGETDVPIKINSKNSQFVVDLLWALGLAQKSLVYEKGPMGTNYKNEAGNFASTGGWTLAKGNAMNYYNKYNLIPLDEKEQERVFEIASNIYRPCCGNHTAFPDCNHGMAALAAIELMVNKGLSDEEIYKNVLKLNSFWFPSNYLTVATYFARQGVPWDKVDAKEALGADFSSAKGASEVAKKVGPLPFETKFGGSCGA